MFVLILIFFFILYLFFVFFFFFSSRRRHTRSLRDWSSDVCSSDLKAAVDQLTLSEAKAGAAAAGAGFVAINVANNAQVEALSGLVGSSSDPQNRLLDDPAVLVFQKPQALYVRLNGYADANTIQQAAINAAPLPAS